MILFTGNNISEWTGYKKGFVCTFEKFEWGQVVDIHYATKRGKISYANNIGEFTLWNRSKYNSNSVPEFRFRIRGYKSKKRVRKLILL